MEKWLGTFDSLGQTFDSSGECFASLRSEKQLSPSESKVCPLESKVCLTIFPSLASIFHVVGTYITNGRFLLQKSWAILIQERSWPYYNNQGRYSKVKYDVLFASENPLTVFYKRSILKLSLSAHLARACVLSSLSFREKVYSKQTFFRGKNMAAAVTPMINGISPYYTHLDYPYVIWPFFIHPK